MILLWISAALLAQTAPLPDGLAPSGQAVVRGLYAESNFGQPDVNETLEKLESDCTARGVTPKIEGRDLQWKGKRRIYRSRDSIAVFEDRPAIAADTTACTAQIFLTRSISVRSAASANPAYGDWIDQHPQCDDGRPRYPRRCTAQTVAGVKATCVNLGDGFVGSIVCYSIQDDLSHDLVLSRLNYSDDGIGPNNGWQLDTVMPDAAIDPVVFRHTS